VRALFWRPTIALTFHQPAGSASLTTDLLQRGASGGAIHARAKGLASLGRMMYTRSGPRPVELPSGPRRGP